MWHVHLHIKRQQQTTDIQRLVPLISEMVLQTENQNLYATRQTEKTKMIRDVFSMKAISLIEEILHVPAHFAFINNNPFQIQCVYIQFTKSICAFVDHFR